MCGAPAMSRSDPYELCLLSGLFVIGSVGASILHRVPPSAERIIPTWGVYLFFVTLALSSAAVLIGMALGTVGGLWLRYGGSIALAGLCGAFSAWTLSASGIAAYRSVIFLGVIMIAALWQSRRIFRALRPRKASR